MRKFTVSMLLALAVGFTTAGAETVDVVYTYTHDGVEIGHRTVTETVGSAPADQAALPSYVTATGYPSTVEAGMTTCAISTSYNCELPFFASTEEKDCWYFVAFMNAYYWYAGESAGKEKTSLGDCSIANQGDYKWKFEGNWLDGFTIQSQSGKYLYASTLPATPAANNFTSSQIGFTEDASTASRFLLDKNGSDWRFKLVQDPSTQTRDAYLAHTSSSALTMNLFSAGANSGTNYYNNGVYVYAGSRTSFTRVEDVRDYFDAFMSFAQCPPVGYPAVGTSAHEALAGYIPALQVNETSTLGGIKSLFNMVSGYYDETNIQLPQDGHVYVFTNMHASAGKHYLYHDPATGELLYGNRDLYLLSELPDCAKYVCHVNGDHFLFANVATGDYLIWRGHNEGQNSHKGCLSDYDATHCSLFMSKCVKSGTLMTGVTTNDKLLGCVNFGGVRPGKGEQCFLYSTATTNNFNQDGMSSFTPRYDNEHSSAFLVEEVTDYTQNNVTLRQASDNNYYSTLWLPYPTNIPEGYKAYTAVPSTTVEGTFDLTELTEGAIPARTGVVLYSETEVEPARFSPAEMSTASMTEKGSLTGSNETVTATGSEYALSGAGNREIGFYPVNLGVGIPAGRAYYAATSAEVAGVKGYTFRFGGNATGIDQAETASDLRNVKVYDLQGRRVLKPAHGIYIVDGRKVFIK